MGFRANLKNVSTKPSVPDAMDNNGDFKEGKPAVMTIQVVVENPPDSLAGLLNRLSNDGKAITVDLSSYQLRMND